VSTTARTHGPSLAPYPRPFPPSSGEREQLARSGGIGRAIGAPWRARLVEFLLVGGATPLLFALSWALRHTVGLDAADYGVGFVFFYGAWVINDPHFAVTYLLFYRGARARLFGSTLSVSARVRYALAGFVLPAGLVAWALVALATRSASSLGLFIQLMFFSVGWHYVKQGFGVFLVLSARRGVRFLPRERLILLTHCLAGWAYAWASPADPGREVEEKGVVYFTVPHGVRLEQVTHAVFLATLLPLVWMLVSKWRGAGYRLPIATPLIALLASLWSWTLYTTADPLVRYMTPALHSVQYLYFVYLLRGGEAREREQAPWFERAASVRLTLLGLSALGLGVLLFHAGPSFLDTAFRIGPPGKEMPLGPTPWFAAVYAFVNLHHYLMDASLWRRDNPETRYLMAPPPTGAGSLA
jgi:hypothetical protein